MKLFGYAIMLKHLGFVLDTISITQNYEKNKLIKILSTSVEILR